MDPMESSFHLPQAGWTVAGGSEFSSCAFVELSTIITCSSQELCYPTKVHCSELPFPRHSLEPEGSQQRPALAELGLMWGMILGQGSDGLPALRRTLGPAPSSRNRTPASFRMKGWSDPTCSPRKPRPFSGHKETNQRNKAPRVPLAIWRCAPTQWPLGPSDPLSLALGQPGRSRLSPTLSQAEHRMGSVSLRPRREPSQAGSWELVFL